jgi:hypothetical protein
LAVLVGKGAGVPVESAVVVGPAVVVVFAVMDVSVVVVAAARLVPGVEVDAVPEMAADATLLITTAMTTMPVITASVRAIRRCLVISGPKDVGSWIQRIVTATATPIVQRLATMPRIILNSLIFTDHRCLSCTYRGGDKACS